MRHQEFSLAAGIEVHFTARCKDEAKTPPSPVAFLFVGYITDPVTTPAIDLGTLPD